MEPQRETRGVVARLALRSLTPLLFVAVWCDVQSPTFAVSGLNHLTFFMLEDGILTARPAVIGSRGRMQSMMCVGWADGEAVVGTGTGKLYKFKDNKLQQAFNGHAGAVNACVTMPTLLVTGGRDGLVKLWSHNLDLLVRRRLAPGACCCLPASFIALCRAVAQTTIDAAAVESCRVLAIKAVDWEEATDRLLFSTAGSEIVVVKNSQSPGRLGQFIVQGHFFGELRALDTHPAKARRRSTAHRCCCRHHCHRLRLPMLPYVCS